MPRNSSYTPSCTINFQTDERTRDALQALARRQERSASALIRIAVRAMLAGQLPPPEQQQQQQRQQRGGQEPAMTA
jgi:hypothetical protein